jgi:CheY-like chemotaxis protein
MAVPDKVILLVEDSADDVFLFKRGLAKARLQNPVQTVQNVDDAIQYLEGSAPYADRSVFPLPSILIIDLRMPSKDGFDLLAWRDAHPEFNNLHVVVMSGIERMQDVSRAYQMGVHSFLTKPIKPEDLRNLANVFPQYWT